MISRETYLRFQTLHTMDFTIVFHLRIISGSSETSFESTNNIFQKSAEGLYRLPGDSVASK